MSSWLEGDVAAVIIESNSASIELHTQGAAGTTTVALYRDAKPRALSQVEGMRRGAMLSLAQRAFTHRHVLRVSVSADDLVVSMKLYAPVRVDPDAPVTHPVEPIDVPLDLDG